MWRKIWYMFVYVRTNKHKFVGWFLLQKFSADCDSNFGNIIATCHIYNVQYSIIWAQYAHRNEQERKQQILWFYMYSVIVYAFKMIHGTTDCFKLKWFLPFSLLRFQITMSWQFLLFIFQIRKYHIKFVWIMKLKDQIISFSIVIFAMEHFRFKDTICYNKGNATYV